MDLAHGGGGGVCVCSEAEGVTRPWSVVFDSRSRVGIEAPERFPWETEGL